MKLRKFIKIFNDTLVVKYTTKEVPDNDRIVLCVYERFRYCNNCKDKIQCYQLCRYINGKWYFTEGNHFNFRIIKWYDLPKLNDEE